MRCFSLRSENQQVPQMGTTNSHIKSSEVNSRQTVHGRVYQELTENVNVAMEKMVRKILRDSAPQPKLHEDNKSGGRENQQVPQMGTANSHIKSSEVNSRQTVHGRVYQELTENVNVAMEKMVRNNASKLRMTVLDFNSLRLLLKY